MRAISVDPATADWCNSHTPSEAATALRVGIAALSAIGPCATNDALAALPPAPTNTPTTTPRATASSYDLGACGEQLIENALRDTFIVRNVSAQAHRGDLSVLIDHHNICVEIKNYSRVVPGAEVAKFLRDIDSTSAAGGVFVSLDSNIAGVNGKFSMRYEHVGARVVPCAYVVSDDPDAAVMATQMIADLIKSACVISPVSDTEAVRTLLDQVDLIKRVRGDLTAEITANTANMIKTCGRLGQIAAAVKDRAERLLDAVPTCTAGRDLLVRLDENPVFQRYDASIKAACAVIVSAIGASSWKLAPRRCVLDNGIGFAWTAVPDVIIPRALVTAENVIDSLVYGKKVTLTADHLCIEISAPTLEWIVELIRGAPSP